MKFAFFSCQDYTFGYYSAHALLLNEDVDFVVNLGDYIYAEAYHSAGSKSGGVRTDPIGVADSLQDYRAKYELYRSDKNLRRMHAKFPMISIWDDHEVIDNYAGGAPGNGEVPPLAESIQRAAATAPTSRACPPTRARPARAPGSTGRCASAATWISCCSTSASTAPTSRVATSSVGPPCPELEQPRDFLGRRQMGFLKRRLDRTPAAWKLIASQTMAMKTIYPGGQYIGFDAWQGYPRERRELLQFIQAKKIKDVAFLTGDIHTFIAGDVRVNDDDKVPAATEFVGGSITSMGLARVAAGWCRAPTPAIPRRRRRIIDLLLNQNPWVKNADPDHHGYGLVRASRSALDVKFRRVAGHQATAVRPKLRRRSVHRTGSGEGRRACSKE